jgi:hypothetical protein
MNYPGNKDTPEQRAVKERAVSKSMLEYLSSTGTFQGWVSAREEYEETMVSDYYFETPKFELKFK